MTVAVLTAFAVSACGSTMESTTSGGATVVRVAGLADVFEKDYKQAVVEPFNQTHDDIEIEYHGYPTSAEMLSAMRSSKSNPAFDVAIMDYSVTLTANAEGLTQKVDPALITNLGDLIDGAVDPDGFGPKLTTDNLSIIYNKQGDAPAPAAFADLADPRYAGRVAIDGPPDIRSLALIAILANGDLTNTAPAFNEFKTIAPNVETWKPNPEVNQYVIAHPGSVGVGWNARAQMFAASNGDLGVVKVPAEGTVLQSNAISLVEGARDPGNSQEFINYALSPETQAAFSKLLAYGPTNSKATLDAELQSKAAEQKDGLVPVDWAQMSSMSPTLTTTWQREVQGG
jgi:putative spermidine/putrescine transport system substrate-binding protein